MAAIGSILVSGAQAQAKHEPGWVDPSLLNQEENERAAREFRGEQFTPEERLEAKLKDLKAALKAAYGDYIYVKRCHDTREGYALVYISDPEFERARTEIAALEGKLKVQGVDVNELWDEAAEDSGNGLRSGDLEYASCQEAFRRLNERYAGLFPEQAKIKKDF